MRIGDYSRVKASLLKQTKPEVDKKLAIIDLATAQKGFTFTASTAGDAPAYQKVAAEEGDGVITLKVPHKTRYITVKHPDFGIYTWRVPGKYLRKKRRYRATLFAASDEKEYKLGWQWVLFDVSPSNAVLYVDSSSYLIRDGGKTLRLATGRHTYRAEAPFYEAVTDTFTLTDTAKVYLTLNLQPSYSYVTVETPWKKADIRIDGQTIGRCTAVSGRLSEGDHKLTVYVRNALYHEESFRVGRSEKKMIEVTGRTVYNRQMKSKEIKAAGRKADTTVYAPVTLTAADDSTEIWLNREKVGDGQWSGKLKGGYYIVTTRKSGVESEPLKFTIEDETPIELTLSVPETGEGMLNIYSNEEGAEIYVNGKYAGQTPCVVKGLPSSRQCQIVLRKQGHKEVRKKVTPRGNNLQDVYIKF